MMFDFQPVQDLPRLAWCARIGKGADAIRVLHGPWVETTDHFFSEGAWDSAFDARGLTTATALMGSGGALTPHGVQFAAPHHTMERLHVIRQGDHVIVSNSLPFLLAQANDDLDPGYLFYFHDFETVIKGLHLYKRAIPTKKRNRVLLFYHCNITIDSNLTIKETAKHSLAPPQSYDDYVTGVRRSLESLKHNAVDPQRRVTYPDLLATVSSGYDSPACAALAKDIGCTRAITYVTAREHYNEDGQPQPHMSDSGTEIGQYMGLEMIEYDRKGYLSLPQPPEAEFLACGTTGQDVVMAPLEDILPGTLFFTGFHGDKAWDLHNKKPGPHIIRGDSSGMSLSEFRLRVGFVHVPIPFINIVHHAAMHAISNSPQMKPWSIGGDYDRPIPRRIAEEHNVPRELFGQKKKAVTQWIWGQNEMTDQAFHELQRFIQTHAKPRSTYSRIYWKSTVFLYRLVYERGIWPVLKRLGKNPLADPITYHRHSNIPGNFLLTIHWGVQEMMARYKLKN